jgi:hypothetical protein
MSQAAVKLMAELFTLMRMVRALLLFLRNWVQFTQMTPQATCTLAQSVGGFCLLPVVAGLSTTATVLLLSLLRQVRLSITTR